MTTSEEIQRRLRDLFVSQKLAVIATHHEAQPYASLVAFFATDDLRYIFFVTPRSTRKYANLRADSRVAVLVNSSSNQDSDLHEAVSVTATGDAEEISGSAREEMLKHYLTKHPYLEDFANSPSCALIRVTAKSYFMVKNFQNVMELHLPQ